MVDCLEAFTDYMLSSKVCIRIRSTPKNARRKSPATPVTGNRFNEGLYRTNMATIMALAMMPLNPSRVCEPELTKGVVGWLDWLDGWAAPEAAGTTTVVYPAT